MTKAPFAAVILAAGKGTRMKSDRPKVMHKLAGRPIIEHGLDAVKRLGAAKVIVVLAPGMDEVAALVRPVAEVAIQSPALGTAHAVLAAKSLLEPELGRLEDVLVL